MIRVDRWVPSDNLKLEPNALVAATEIERNLALTAGPGAGKTEMLAQRADFLLRTGTCRYPIRILAISFKVDASQNLKARVRNRCGSELAARFDSHTFHAFAKRIIDRFRLALTGRDALDLDYSIGPARIQRQSITFADMVPLAVTIVETSEIARNAIRQTYSHVFLDEFQDCTKEQYRLITACFLGTGAKLVAVGDTKQRIMGWAGALEGIFKTYAADFNAKPLNLYQNFRSAPRLAAELSRMVELAAGYGEAEIRRRLRLTLLESAPRILSAFPEAVSDLAASQLRLLGVDVRTGVRVVAADADGFQLEGSERVLAALKVWAAGIRASASFDDSGLELNRAGQVVVGPNLLAKGEKHIFALGDCASLVPEGAGRPLPSTAQVANQQAMHLICHLPNWLRRGKPVPRFSFRDFGALVALSDYNAFGTLGRFGFFKGGFIKGRFAQLSHAVLYRRHQLSLHGPSRAALLWLAERINALVQPTIRIS